MSPSARLGTPPLVRLLQELVPGDADRAPADVAARLGDWLGAMDSIKLEGALQAITAFGAQARSPGQPVDAPVLQQELTQLGALLSRMFSAPGDTTLPPEHAGEYAPHLKRFVELQKQMEQRVGALRNRLHQLLGKGSPRLRQLVALDAALHQLMGDREHKLLGNVPVLLERRFNARRDAHQARLAALGQTDDPTTWRLPGGWLDTFQRDMRDVLQAELQLRLQPLQGLIEAAQEDLSSRT